MALFLLCFLLVPGCGSPPARGSSWGAPSDKLGPIREAGQRYEADAEVPTEVLMRLVEQLDSDDHAVRMMAIHALERITGTRLGFDPYAPRHLREPAVRRWRDHVGPPPLGKGSQARTGRRGGLGVRHGWV